MGEDVPHIQTMLYNAYQDSSVNIWVLNEDADRDFLLEYRDTQDMHPSVERIDIPILYQAYEAFDQFKVGSQYDYWLPVYFVIDQEGNIVTRTQYMIFEEAAETIEGLLNE